MRRYRIDIQGVVQGVGFRPFVFQLAHHLGVHGWVLNDSRGVTVEAEAETSILDAFLRALEQEKPPLAVITALSHQSVSTLGEEGFVIRQSQAVGLASTQVPPDTYVCEECLDELFDPGDRRYQYPFINCTNCGPRYTIVTGIPYDRSQTTMVDFPMCPDCQAEYDDPGTRRFHAQPNACPACGPQLELRDAAGQEVACEDPLAATVVALKQGQVVAVKGLGGYHLAVDAGSDRAVELLRQRKQRDEKPFALMAATLDAVGRFALVDDTESRLLSGPERPIVLLQKKSGHHLSEGIAPGNRYFGVMLPYTPLHYLLLDHFEALVMTSANLSDEPIAFEDHDAIRRLGGIADLFLVHNRRIETRTDDSIARVMGGHPLLLRRSRGYVPRALSLPVSLPPLLAVGAELKSSVCLARDNRAMLSQHIGDIKNLDVYESFSRTISKMQTLFDVVPEVLAHDLHPDYDSTRYAREKDDVALVAVQHHHAHLASCLAEHGEAEPAIGVIFDGIGYGDDGKIWGGEFLLGDLKTYQRVGHFRYLPMPGGDLATREPWRMAFSALRDVYGQVPEVPCLASQPQATLDLISTAIERQINSPLTSSCGRLFDAVSSLLGVRHAVTYEGQAALDLEMIADPSVTEPLPYDLLDENGQLIFDSRPMISALLEALRGNAAVPRLAGRFHLTLADMIHEVCLRLRRRSAPNTVALSGGVFQNCLLTELTLKKLHASGFRVLTHSLVPPNDGGLSLGQAVVAGLRSAG